MQYASICPSCREVVPKGSCIQLIFDISSETPESVQKLFEGLNEDEKIDLQKLHSELEKQAKINDKLKRDLNDEKREKTELHTLICELKAEVDKVSLFG